MDNTQIENTCHQVISLNIDISNIDKEIKRLQVEKKLKEELTGELKAALYPFKDKVFGLFKIWIKKTEAVNVSVDPVELPEEFKRVKVEPDKIGLKKALAAGQKFNGVSIEEREHVQIDLV
jgi:hypothetical protein